MPATGSGDDSFFFDAALVERAFPRCLEDQPQASIVVVPDGLITRQKPQFEGCLSDILSRTCTFWTL